MGSEFRSLVTSDMFGDTMFGEDMDKEELSECQGIDVSVVGIKVDFFVSRSNMMRMAEYLEDFRSFLMKSMDIEFQGRSGMGRGFRVLKGLWRTAFDRGQMVQDLQ